MCKPFVYVLCFAFLLVSCQEENVDGVDEVVVEGWIEAGGSPIVMLSNTFVVTAEDESDGNQSVVLPWGKITVSDGVNSAVLTGDYDERYFPPFIYSTSKIRGVPGRTYYLTVEYGDRVLTAETTIPMPASLDALEVSSCAHTDSVYQITACYTDNPETKDYYLFLTRIFNRETRFYPSFLGVIDDETLGLHNRYVVQPGPHKLTSDNHVYGPYYRASDTVQVKFARIDETTYQIHKAYSEVVALTNNPVFASDILIPTNIKGGLGFWCGYAATKYNVVIADSVR